MANPDKIVTRDGVFEVADRLKASGTEPTNRKVLHELGGGSMTTIAGHLRDWKALQAVATPAPQDIAPAPPAVVDAGQLAITTIWQICTTEAQREIDAVMEQAKQRVQAVEEERDGALTELAEAENELSSAHDASTALSTRLDQIHEQLRQLQALNAQLQSEADKARAIAEEVERRAAGLADSLQHERDRAERVQAEREQLRSHWLHADAARAGAEQQAAVLTEKLDSLTQRVTQAETHATEARREAARAMAEAAELRGQLAALERHPAKPAHTRPKTTDEPGDTP